MEFPIYRKYKGIDVWFKVLSLTQFIEYKKLGSQLVTLEVNATIFPEKQFIQDLISCYEDRWEVVSKDQLTHFIS